MLKHFFVILILGAFCCFLFGTLNIFRLVEDNQCRMTYMFGQPQFSRVKFEKNKQFSNYGLYYYYEGRVVKDVNSLNLDGAPVIFVPGNGGSYKQARSLASVALRKAMNNDHGLHFDYFTIDYNEELSGLYGGYLQNQKQFLKASVVAVLRLYKKTPKNARKIVVIGHSMGGKIAQALLTDITAVNLINTILTISAPLDNPVVNFDSAIAAFYKESNAIMSKNRPSYASGSDTNVCDSILQKHVSGNTSYLLEDLLLISVGGGNRDLLVRAGLTTSQFSDIHSMTSAIPDVWLSCDHLSAVWCLQFVLVVTRFLFSIVSKDANNLIVFEEDKSLRLQTATHYFVKPVTRPKRHEVEFTQENTNGYVWVESSKIVLNKQFPNGLKQTYNHMLPLEKVDKLKKLYMEIANGENNHWLYGCKAQTNLAEKLYCESVKSLSHHIRSVPSGNMKRSIAILDLNNIKKSYSNWTHIVMRVLPTHKPVQLIVDMHDPTERYFRIRAPRWYAVKKKYLNEETPQGTLYYKVLVEDLTESFHTLQINIEKRACTRPSYRVTTKVCVPWARGFDKYQTITDTSSYSVLVNIPTFSPVGYNTSKNPVTVDIYLDPVCRYSISYQYSLANTMSRIVQEFYHWLPAHLVAVLCIVLKNQVSKFDTQSTFQSTKPYIGFFQYTSLYVITGCRILHKILTPIKGMPIIESSHYSFYASAIVHSTAIASSILLSFGVWMLLTLHGTVIHKLSLRITNICSATLSVLVPILTHLPIAFGVLVIAIAIGTCSGLALILASVFYLIMLSNAYKDYLDEWLCESASKILKKAISRNQHEDHHQNVSLLSDAPEDVNENHRNGNNAITSRISATTPKAAEENSDTAKGLRNFSFHITMLLLLLILASLNATATIAWVKNYRIGPSLPDTSLMSTILVLGSLSIMWQMKTPISGLGCRILSVSLYACASAAVLYCQEAVYRLNYVIASIYSAVLLQQVLSKLWQWLRKEN